jgi:hypothetical protein
MMLFCLSVSCAVAEDYPIKNAPTAIEIAKLVCKGKVDVDVEWEAHLGPDSEWLATTEPSTLPGKAIRVVRIPINGPRPTKCEQGTYGVIN